jgi:alpha-mannosidase
MRRCSYHAIVVARTGRMVAAARATLVAAVAAGFIAALLAAGAPVAAQTATPPTAPPAPLHDPANPQLYTVATAHLDTQWRWTIRETIDEYIPATLHDNFALFDRYPYYTFSFEGAFRYMLMKEYYPQEYERLKQYIATGRWRVAGSWVDAVDTNIPAPESLIRQSLYGNGYFWREFGVTSRDVFLPDCFGFGYALPSVAAHCGLTGFSTQKLDWGAAVGRHFDIGLWEGVDGAGVIAALSPGAYVSKIDGDLDLSADSTWLARAQAQGALSGVYAAMRYFGVGDTGGAPPEQSVAALVRGIEGTGPLRVRSVASDQLARDLTAGLRGRLATGLRPRMLANLATDPAYADIKGLPRCRGEFLMTDHGTGCYTSEAAMKRFNRKNERLAEAAERSALVAHWLGASLYPREALRGAWVRFLWHQFHDDLTGTSIPEAYAYSWNDEQIALNEFGTVLGEGVGAASRALETNVQGVPLVVYNPLALQREDVVTADVVFEAPAPASARVYGPDGREVPSQVLAARGAQLTLLFVASAPAAGYAVYEARAAEAPCSLATELAVTERSIENATYRVTLDSSGDIASVFDKGEHRELLAAPLQLQLIEDEPTEWPAWEVDFADLMAAPRALVGGPARVRVVEQGPARAALEVVRELAGSRFVQRISLAAGEAGDRVTVDLDLDWRTPATLLKAAFPLAVSNDIATYDLGLGVIQRRSNSEQLYEVPAQQWAAIDDPAGDYGVAVLNDSRYGWDKPDDHTLRLSLVRTPRVNANWQWVADQGSQDLGRHRVTYALCGYHGDWRDGRLPEVGDRLNQPLRAFQTGRHTGSLGRVFSFARVEQFGRGAHPSVAIRALKLAEESDEVIVRLEEMYGRAPTNVQLAFARPVLAAREVNGAEEPVSDALPVRDGVLDLTFGSYQPRTVAVQLEGPALRLGPAVTRPLDLPYDLDGISGDGDRADGDFDGAGHALAAELLPEIIVSGGIPFRPGPPSPGRTNVVACRGQRIALPQGDYDRLYLLAAAVGGDREATLAIETAAGAPQPARLWIQDYAEPVGQWDSRLAAGSLVTDPASITPAYAKPAAIGWVGTHRHTSDGKNEAYALTCAFRYALALPPGARAITLPDDPGVRLLAMTIARNPNDAARATQPFYDTCPMTVARIEAPLGAFVDSMSVTIGSPTPGALIRYTLDGSEPTGQSAFYDAPLTLTNTTTVRARAYAEGFDPAFVAQATFTRMTPRPATPLAGALPGLVCRYYEGAWDKLPAFDSLAAQGQATVPAIALPAIARPEEFALRMDGYITVPGDGVYAFRLASDDGSALWIDGERVIDNDGLHGNQERICHVALRAGAHAIRIEYFQRGGDRGVALLTAGPGIALQPVPAGWLVHAAEQE